MNDNDSQNPPASAESPPPAPGTSPDPALLPPATPGRPAAKWPMTIAIIALIFGALGLLSAPMQIVGYFGVKLPMEDLPDVASIQEEVDAFLANYLAFLLVSGAVEFLLAAALVAGGILLLKRRRKSVPLIKSWAGCKILASLVICVFTFIHLRTQSALMAGGYSDLGESGEQMVSTVSNIVGGVIAIATLLWALALPVFLLIWFARRKIRAEVEDWS